MAARIRVALSRADVVLLEYPFWAAVVAPEARRSGKKLVMTAHDILSDQVTCAPLRRLLWRWERKALLAADAVVAVSPEDVARLRQHGIKAELAPNPVDIALFTPGPSPARAAAAAPRLDIPFRQFALFVGSRHPPNLAAVEHLRAIGEQLATIPRAADIGIVVAGSCAPPGRAERVVMLGVVEQALLLELYRQASAVVIPLPGGTGSSLKTIEAMAAGLPVLGTSAAFRGLPVVDGETVIVENEPARFAERLVDLLHDEARCADLGAAAHLFAGRFDYRVCYAPYLDLLGVTDHRAASGVKALDPVH
jgi:glycosyltransferase involved in cell wall biosynthesis